MRRPGSPPRLPFEAARAQFELGSALGRQTPELAIGHAARALAGFEELGAALDADRVAAFLRALGVPHGPAQGSRRAHRSGAGGARACSPTACPTPRSPSRLYVSRKTAAHHVSRILAKLNLRNRAEAAAYARDGRPSTRRSRLAQPIGHLTDARRSAGTRMLDA